MTVISLAASDSKSTARICVDRGFNCFSFQADIDGRIVDVIDSIDGFEAGEGRPSGNGTPILFPFPNRIRGGRFSWQGRDYQLPPEVVGFDNTGNAIHGFVINRPWRVIDQGGELRGRRVSAQHRRAGCSRTLASRLHPAVPVRTHRFKAASRV